jgi:hypothetical protein
MKLEQARNGLRATDRPAARRPPVSTENCKYPICSFLEGNLPKGKCMNIDIKFRHENLGRHPPSPAKHTSMVAYLNIMIVHCWSTVRRRIESAARHDGKAVHIEAGLTSPRRTQIAAGSNAGSAAIALPLYRPSLGCSGVKGPGFGETKAGQSGCQQDCAINCSKLR